MEDLTEDENELIEMMRLLKKSKHNPSEMLKKEVIEMFFRMID